MESPFEIQIICSTPGDVSRAQRSGATRIELAGCYTAGGVTPSPGTIRSCLAATDLPVVVALRPREGHLVYSASEKDIILQDAEWCLEQGAHQEQGEREQGTGLADHWSVSGFRVSR